MVACLLAPEDVIFQPLHRGDGFFPKANLACIPPNGDDVLKQGILFS